MTVKRLAANKWEVRVSVGGVHGRKQYRRTVLGSKDDAKRVEAQLYLKHGKSVPRDDRLTLREFVFDRWLPNADVTDYTRYVYALHMNKVCEALGHVRLDALMAEQLERYFAHKEARTLALKEYQTLRTGLNVALRWGLVTQNPCNLIPPPRKPHKKPPEVYSLTDVQEIMEAVRGQWWEALWLLGIFCGLRPEESTALDVPPRNWDGALRVERAYAYAGKGRGWVLAPTKTETSNDTVYVPSEIVARILDITEGRAGSLARPDYMDADYRANRNYFSRHYKLFCEREGLRHIPPKNFRHTAATLMLEAGAQIQVVSNVLRHAHVSTTKDSYLGIVEGAKHAAAETLLAHIKSDTLPTHL